MTTLHTIVPLHPSPRRIRYGDAITMIGSCFTEHIGSKLERYKYDVLTHPFGILYNPASMARSLERVASMHAYTEADLVLQDGLYHSMDHHGSFSDPDLHRALTRINTSLEIAHEHLKKSSFVFLSPGTVRVYRYKPTGSIAGNCHKIPASQFDAEVLSIAETLEACERMHRVIASLVPDAMLIWTVSPVRHVRDGLVQNQRSKAALILAASEMERQFFGTQYFPAYEIMMDELRDYRFYARDMVHPSKLAIDLIWNRFVDTYLHADDQLHHGPIEAVRRSMEHRFLHDDAASRRRFAALQLERIDQLATVLPLLNWQEERQHFFQMTEPD